MAFKVLHRGATQYLSLPSHLCHCAPEHTWRHLYLPLPLPDVPYPQILTWLVPSLPSGLYLYITSSRKASLTTLYRTATPSTSQHSLITFLHYAAFPICQSYAPVPEFNPQGSKDSVLFTTVTPAPVTGHTVNNND